MMTILSLPKQSKPWNTFQNSNWNHHHHLIAIPPVIDLHLHAMVLTITFSLLLQRIHALLIPTLMLKAQQLTLLSWMNTLLNMFVTMSCCADSISLGTPNPKKHYGLKAGLCKFAKRGNNALMKELCQFHMLKCFTPKDPKTLSCDDKCNALASLRFLTEK
jgi:hypothetical protein